MTLAKDEILMIGQAYGAFEKMVLGEESKAPPSDTR